MATLASPSGLAPYCQPSGLPWPPLTHPKSQNVWCLSAEVTFSKLSSASSSSDSSSYNLAQERGSVELGRIKNPDFKKVVVWINAKAN